MHYVPPASEAWTSHDLDRLARAASSDHGGSTWQAVLSTLVDIHPGAQRALLAIRQGTHFEVQGVTGYPADLLNLRLPLHTERAWYGQSEAAWYSEQSRQLSGTDLQGHLGRIETLFGPQDHYRTLRERGDLSTLQANFLQPFTCNGEVVAHLNIDGVAALPSLPEHAVNLLRTLIQRSWTASADAHLRERNELWEMARLGDLLRPITDPHELLQAGLRRVAAAFGATGQHSAQPSRLDPTRSITEPCLDGFLTLTWSAPTSSRPLAQLSLRSLADRVHHAHLREQQRGSLLESRNHALELIGAALEARDLETQGHTRRVAHWAQQVARAADLDPEESEALHLGALLHDLGKLAIPDAILLKPGPLTDQERAVMQRHPGLGAALAQRVPHLPDGALDVVRSHHEHWNGGGYPAGLRGEEIPRPARLFAVIDTYDALTSDRPYRAAWTPQAAWAEVQRLSGQQFDPWAVQLTAQILHPAES